MSNLLASLGQSASALDVFQHALDTVQNNVTNASTPGYARQSQIMESAPFDLANGLLGGVRDGGTESARSEYAETSVRGQATVQGQYDAMAASLAQIENVFDVSGTGGVPGALSQLFKSFSAWSVTPSDSTAKQAVIEQAGQVAQAFSQTASQLTQARTGIDGQINTVIDQINQLGSQLQQYNDAIRNGQSGASLDSRLYSTLEDLSQYVDFTVMREPNGTATVLLGGQIPLVTGNGKSPTTLSPVPVTDPAAKNAGATPPLHVFAGGEDLSGIVSQGQLSGLLEVRNEVIPSLIGDSQNDGQLNTLASGFAARVNSLLNNGQVSAGGAAGASLFVFDASGATTPSSIVTAASTLRVNPDITPDQLAAYQPATATAPAVANGVALALAGLATPASDDDRIDGLSYTQYYAGMASAIGNKSATAKDQQALYTQLTAQARSVRQQMSGVSLDQEAAFLLQFQRSYQATARMITVLNDLSEVAVNLGKA